jgi:nicotinamidase-related amidase
VADKARIGWIVDVQRDFMEPDGRLYVKDLGNPDDPGAERVRGRIVEAVDYMRQHCDLLVYTGDWHGYDDAEIDPDDPDPARGTYPPHCMGRSSDPDERAGAEIIAEIRPENPEVLPVGADAGQAEQVALRVAESHRPVFIHKVRFDVFEGNPGTEPFLDALSGALGRPLSFVVVGVARDVCVSGAVDGLQARGYDVTALADATWGLGLEPEATTLARWAERGRVTTLAALAAP